MDAPRLFVYGTLRRGFRHPMHALLEAHGRFVGEARVRGRLYDLGPYPAMIPAEGEACVHGELYELDAEWPRLVAALDRYEGPEYRRQRVEAELATGVRVAAWAYVLARETEGLRRIESGEWQRAGRAD